jgi:anti-sigma-K factor RskA
MTSSAGTSGAHDCAGDAAAYALGALDPPEAGAFERHLEGCVVCRDELAALRQVVHALPMAAAQHPVPNRLRRQLLREVREQNKPRSSTRARRGLIRGARIWRALVLAGACAAIAFAIFAAFDFSGVTGVRVIRARVMRVTGSATVRLESGHGELIVRHLSPPPPGDTYEIWLKRPHREPTPINALFSVTTTGAGQIGLPPNLRGVKKILVTPEPKGGSPFPTRRPVIVAHL